MLLALPDLRWEMKSVLGWGRERTYMCVHVGGGEWGGRERKILRNLLSSLWRLASPQPAGWRPRGGADTVVQVWSQSPGRIPSSHRKLVFFNWLKWGLPTLWEVICFTPSLLIWIISCKKYLPTNSEIMFDQISGSHDLAKLIQNWSSQSVSERFIQKIAGIPGVFSPSSAFLHIM